jgi:hypothetical protein
MVKVQDRCNRGDFFGEKAQVELGIALLNHASQKAWSVDATLRLVNGTAIAPHSLLMTSIAFVLSN